MTHTVSLYRKETQCLEPSVGPGEKGPPVERSKY